METYKDHLAEITLKYKVGPEKKVKITSSQNAYEALRPLYDPDTISLAECFICLFLNRANTTIGWFKVSQGGIAGTIFDIKLVMATAIKCAASAIIISHNHPSGNLEPSEADKTITSKLKKACQLIDVAIHDHIIMSEESYRSMGDEGEM